MSSFGKILACAAAVSSASIVGWELRVARPPLPPLSPPPVRARSLELARGEPVTVDWPETIELPPTVIVGTRPVRQRARAAVDPSENGPFGDMTCSGWRPLAMGSGAVRVCE